MNYTKKVIGSLTECYAITTLNYNGSTHLLVASEKNDKCQMFDLDGNYEDTLWDSPGGVMTMEQIPNTNGKLLTIQNFYSPNNAGNAKIMLVSPKGDKNWERRLLVDLPFVHRFGILQRGGINYLVAGTVKSAHAFYEDWTCPGRVWVAELPKDLANYNEENPLKMIPIISGLYRNHGLFKFEEDGYTAALIGADNGVIKLVPPEKPGGDWSYETILEEPTSDMILLDFDGDGEDELLTFSPFHGNRLRIYKKINGSYNPIYEHHEPLEFLHAIWGGIIDEIPTAIIGYRSGSKELLAITCQNPKTQDFKIELMDSGCGSANVLYFTKDNKDYILSANREIDEIAMYEID